jgi:trk system potassium uptake protein TrkA
VAQALPKSVILNGDILDGDIMEEAGISSAETFISVSNDDEVNFISCLLAKRYGVSRTVALINKLTYAPLIRSLGIDVAVNPRVITVSSILQHVRRGRIRGLHSVQEDFGEVIEVEVLETSPLAGKTVADVKLPEGVMLGVRLRDEKISVVRGSTDFLAGDRLVLFATYEAVKKVEKLFAVRFDFF